MMIRTLRLAIITLSAVTFAFTLALSSPATVALADTSTHHAVQLDSPAVVRIVTGFNGTVTCFSCASDGSNVVFPQNGTSYQVASSGSGAIVSPNGYILTADHVVDSTNNSELQNYFLQQAISDNATLQGVSVATSQQEFQTYANSVSIQIQKIKTLIYLSTSYTGQLQNVAQITSYTATRIVANSTPDKQDVAVLKIEATDLPFMPVLPTASVNIQDTVTAIAFPGDADYVLNGSFITLLNPLQSDVNTVNSLLSPSVNTGQITAQKTQSDGTLIYEVNGISSQGSSGGPVINSQGQIIGFVDSGPSTDRITNLIASNIANEYVTQSGVTGQQSGAFMSLWSKAYNEYDSTGACHFTNAKRDLTSIHTQYPNFGAIIPLLQQATLKATPSECPAPSSTNGGLIAALAVILLLALGGGGFYFYTISKQPKPAAALPWNAQGYIGEQHQSSPYGSYTTPTAGGYNMPPPPQAPYNAPIPPTVVVEEPSGTSVHPAPGAPSAPPSGPTQLPPISGVASSAPITPAQTATGTRSCTQGHIVHDATAKFCPECGSPIA